MKKRSKKLVPLMPILVQLGACPEGLKWVRSLNYKTFAEAWANCDEPGLLKWIVCDGMRRAGAIGVDEAFSRSRTLADAGVFYLHSRPSQRLARRVRARFDRVEVERALYDYAVREGLA